jgi:hypothetical protein
MRFACRVKEDPASGGKSSGPLGPPTPDFLECDDVTGARDPADDLFDWRHNPGKAVNIVCGDRYWLPVHYFVIVFDLMTSTAPALLLSPDFLLLSPDFLLLSPVVSTIQACHEDRHRLIRRSRL